MFILLDIEQTLLQHTNVYHGTGGIGDYTLFQEDATTYTLEEINTIMKVLPNEKLLAIPQNFGLNDALTISEACELYNKESSTFRKLVNNDKLIDGIDYRKSKNTWLFSKQSLDKIYNK